RPEFALFLIARKREEESMLIGSGDKARIKRYVFPVKHNWAWPEPVNMVFEIIDGKPIFETTDIDSQEILNPTPGRRPVQSSKAKEIITEMFLDRDEIPSIEIEERCASAGISEKTVKRVKKEEGYGRGYGKKANKADPDFWVWKKP
ncbi:unnamed protein product, partial [marine sediment metagenome]